MPFAPSSVGDIIALVTLAAQIYQALDDTKGSSSQYRELVQQLKSFQTTLRVAELSLSRPDVIASEAAVERINEEIRACRKLLDKFDEHVRAYRQALTRNRRSAIVAIRQIMWSLTKQRDIAELRQNLTQHSQTITILMNVLILSVKFRPPFICSNIHHLLKLQRGNVRRLYRRQGWLDGNQNSCSRDIGIAKTGSNSRYVRKFIRKCAQLDRCFWP